MLFMNGTMLWCFDEWDLMGKYCAVYEWDLMRQCCAVRELDHVVVFMSETILCCGVYEWDNIVLFMSGSILCCLRMWQCCGVFLSEI